MRNIIGNLLQAFIQFKNAPKHDIEIAGETVKLIPGTINRQSPCQVAIHNALRSTRNFIDALKCTPPNEEPDQKRTDTHNTESQHKRTAYKIAETLRLTQIATYQQAHAIRQCNHNCNRTVFSLCSLLTIAAIFEGALDNAIRIQHARLNTFNIAG